MLRDLDHVAPVALAELAADGDFEPDIRRAGDAEHARCVARQHAERKRRIEAGRRRWATLNRFVDSVAPCVSPVAQAAYLHMFRHADRAGRVQRTIGQIAAGIGMSGAAARRAVAELRRAGVIRVRARGSIARGGTVYAVVMADTDDPPSAISAHG